MNNFIVGKWQNKILAPRIHYSESKRVVIAGAKQWIGLKIFQRVMHPAHVPFEIKTEAAGIDGMTDKRPGGRLFSDHQGARTFAVGDFVQLFEKSNRFQILAPA